ASRIARAKDRLARGECGVARVARHFRRTFRPGNRRSQRGAERVAARRVRQPSGTCSHRGHEEGS
ncbi:MAG: hypothetical protein MHM6MM_009654, partial [Cercozoa sp. M6MM]